MNTYVFVYQFFFISADIRDRLFFQLGFIPWELTHAQDMLPLNLVPLPLTIITSMFLHGGWVHFLGNMLYLWVFGINMEDRLGHCKYLLFYLACGVAAALVHGVANMPSKVPCVGASGAIAGVLGAYWILFPKVRIQTLFVVFVFAKIIKLPALIVLGFWIFTQFLSGFADTGPHHQGGVAWFAHVGGVVAGIIIILFLENMKSFICSKS